VELHLRRRRKVRRETTDERSGASTTTERTVVDKMTAPEKSLNKARRARLRTFAEPKELVNGKRLLKYPTLTKLLECKPNVRQVDDCDTPQTASENP
jgi:hypothetical protein